MPSEDPDRSAGSTSDALDRYRHFASFVAALGDLNRARPPDYCSLDATGMVRPDVDVETFEGMAYYLFTPRGDVRINLVDSLEPIGECIVSDTVVPLPHPGDTEGDPQEA